MSRPIPALILVVVLSCTVFALPGLTAPPNGNPPGNPPPGAASPEPVAAPIATPVASEPIPGLPASPTPTVPSEAPPTPPATDTPTPDSTQVPPTPPLPAPPVAPVAPIAPVAPVAPLVVNSLPPEELIPLQFINSDVKEVLGLYERLTKKRLIYSNQLVGSVYIFVGQGGVPKDEAIKIIEMNLMMNGFYIVPTEDEGMYRVTNVGLNPKSIGVPFIADENMLPGNEQVVMFLMKLKHADPTELAQTIQQGILVPNQAGFTTVVPLPKANSLLITENTAMIRTLIRIIKAIDVEPVSVMSEFITLEHAEAEDVVQKLEKLFDKQQQGAAGGPAGAPGQPRVARTAAGPDGQPVPAGQPTPDGGTVSLEINGGNGFGPTEDNIIIGKAKLTADKRTNRIHIMTRDTNMKLIRTLIREFDADSKIAAPAVYPLRHRPVEEVIDAVVSAIKDPGEKDGGGGGSATAAAPGAPAGARPAQTGQNNRGSTGSDRFGGSSSGGGGGSNIQGESLSTGERSNTPISQQVGKSTIIADLRTNSMIVIGTSDVKEKVFAIVDKLDVEQSQVMIYTVIGELTLTDNLSFGLESILSNALTKGVVGATPGTGTGTGVLANVPGASFNPGANINPNVLASSQIVDKIVAVGSGGLSGFIAAGTAFDAVLNTLESTNRFRVITRPMIFTTNNKRAVITSGEQIPVPTSINSSYNQGNNTNNTTGVVSNSQIQYKDIALTLEVLPRINDRKDVELEIVQNISQPNGVTVIDNNKIPNVTQRALKTYVTVPNQNTLILGGLIKDSTDRTRNGVPYLARLPVIGPLFGNATKEKLRTELIVMMRPVVTFTSSETVKLREKALEAFTVPPDIESAITPSNLRQKIKPEAPLAPPPPILRQPTPVLREETAKKKK